MPETSGTSTVDVCPKIISISTPTKEDIDYARKLLQNPENIKQSDLRDNMVVREYNEKGEIVDTLRSAKLEREYQEWQEEVRKKVEAKDKRNKEREAKQKEEAK